MAPNVRFNLKSSGAKAIAITTFGLARIARCSAFLMTMIALAPATSFANDVPANPLYLSPIVDGIQKDGVVAVIPYKDGVLVSPKGMTSIGISPEIGTLGPNGDIFIPSAGPVSASIDMQNQIVRFTVPQKTLLSTVTAVSTPVNVTPASSATGVFVNYDFNLIAPFGGGQHQGQTSLSGSLMGVLFSRYGFLDSNNLILVPQSASAGSQSTFTRLNTTYEFDQPDVPRAWRVGDVITNPPGWGRSEFLGGFQVATDYGLQPNTITFPTPIIGQSLAQPSDVSLLVNNANAYQGNLNAGPFSLVGIPVINGLNEVTIQTRTPSGEIVSQTVPFYASTTMLAAGLTSYNVSTGYIRHNYGQINDFYSTPAFDGTLNYGITNYLTGSIHTEDAPNLDVMGGAMETSGNWGDLTGAFAVSEYRPSGDYKHRTGRLFAVEYSRYSPIFGISAGIVDASTGYNDLGIETNTLYPALSWHVTGSMSLPAHYGSIETGYTDQAITPHQSAEFYLGSYSVQFFRDWDFIVSGFKGTTSTYGVGRPSDGFNIGISIPLGGSNIASVSINSGSGQSPEYGETYQNYPPTVEGFGGSAGNYMGDYTSRYAQLQDVNQYTEITADIAQYKDTHTAQLQASGSVIAMDGLYFSRPTNNSFAVVDLGYPNIPAYLANQPVGQTDSSGKILVPSLLPNYPNKLSIDPNALPLSASIVDDNVSATPPTYGGVVVKFPAAKMNAAFLTIELAGGTHPPPGSLLYVAGNNAPLIIGYDGNVYIQDPPRHLTASVIMTAERCHLSIDLPPAAHSALIAKIVKCTK